MDLYLKTTRETLAEILTSLGFEVEENAQYTDAKLKDVEGRFHAMFARLEDNIYCDLHYDKNRHKWFIGVDYHTRPQEFFEKSLKKALDDRGVEFEVKKVNWFTRRNKTISGGFKL